MPITLINGYPQGPNSLIVPNGSISFQLNVDATVVAAPGGFVAADLVVVFQFNSAGQIQPNTGNAAQIYSNAELNPQDSSGLGTYYLVTFYDQNGARLNKNPMWWQFPEAAGSTVDISQMIPFSTVGGNVIFYPTLFGPPGPAGPTGPQGPQGPAGSSGSIFAGPSPWYDITYYGARALSSFETTTATTASSSSTSVTVASAIDFQMNDGIVIWKAGNAAASASAPTAPTVSCAAVTGSNTFNYLCVGVDEFGGLSANSAATQITNAPAIFGNLPVQISSISQSSGVVTVNTATPINAVEGQQVTIVGIGGAGAGFIGTYAVASAPTSSHFTYALSGNAGSGSVSSSSTARLSNTYNITAITRTGTTISITTNADHNFNAQTSGGAYNYKATVAVVQGIDQQTNASGTADLNGEYVILSASGNSLTLQSAIDYGSATETGVLTGTEQWQPTVTVYEYITVTCPLAYPEPFAYYVYADYTNSGTYTLIGRTLPYQGTFIDYGPWQNQDFAAPAYVPTTITLPAGIATQNQLYVGKITNISGNTLTVTPAVPTQVTSVTAMHDNTVAIQAAMTAAAAAADGTIYIPPSTGSFILNAPLKMPSNSYFNFLVGSKIVANETIMNLAGQFMSWKAAPGISGAGGVAQFGQDAPVPIVGLANPMLFSYNGPLQIQGLGFTGTHSCGQVYVNTIGSGGDNFSAVDCTFIVGGATAGTTIPVILQAGSGYQACPHFTNCTFVGYSYGIGNGAAAQGNIHLGPNIPLLSLRADESNNLAPQGLIMDGNNTFAGRGILFDGSFGQFTAQAQISIYENEAPCTPTLMIWGQSSGGHEIKISHLVNDSQPGAIIGNWAEFSVAPCVTINDCNMSGTSSMLTGSIIGGLVVTNCISPIGQNVNYQALKIGQGGNGQDAAALTGTLYEGFPIAMAGLLNPGIFWPFTPPGSVSASASGSGTIGAATYSVFVTAVGWNGFESLAGYPASVTVNGSQGIASSWTAMAGVQGYNVYLLGGSGSAADSPVRQNNALITTNSYTFTSVSNDGAFPGVDNSGLPLLDGTGLTTPMIRLTDPVKQNTAVQYYTQTVTLTSSQLLALYATPIQILPAPGSNLMYVIQSVSVQYRYSSAAYTLNSATNLILGFGSTPASYPVAEAALSGLVTATHSVVTQAAFTNSNNASSDVINAALYATNDVANLSGGSGTVTLVISYAVVNATAS